MFNKVQSDGVTFLSPSVKHLLVDSKGDHLTYDSCGNNYYVTTELTLDWDRIFSHLGSLAVADTSKQVYEAVCQKLWPVFIECGRSLQKCDTLPEHLWQWTNCQEDIELCFKEVLSGIDVITPCKTALILTSIFENAIGNVYLLKKKDVPFLLRDLLVSNDLISTFGKLPMLVAQTMLGTPFAMNLRNVCWHGFPAPHEIHIEIAAALIVLITSFGKILDDLSLISLPYRSKVDEEVWGRYVPSLQNTGFPQLNEIAGKVLKLISECDIIPDTHRLYWTSSFNFLLSERHGECLVLLLPGLEHVLRCTFCSINNCPDKVLVAEQHTLYTTMDEILDQHVYREQENKLPLKIGIKAMEMLMDMFNSFNGPRLRDKLSHGECDFKMIPAVVANHMFCVAVIVLLKLQHSENAELNDYFAEVERNYSVKFHSISLLKCQVTGCLEKLSTIAIYFRKQDSAQYIISDDVVKCQLDLVTYSSKFQNFCDDDILKHIDLYLNKPMVSLYRTKSDLSNIGLLKKIVLGLEQASSNCLVALKTREANLSQHALRSRQRTTLSHMLHIIPSFLAVLKCIILVVLIQLQALPKQTVNSRFLKNILQYSENIASLSALDKNRWIEIREKTGNLCNGFMQSLHPPAEEK